MRWIKPKSAVGIDISPDSIKLVELVQDGRRARLGAFGDETLESGLDLRNPQHAKRIGQQLHQLIRHCGCQARNAVVGIPVSAGISRIITMPGYMNDEQIEANLEVDSAQHIPFPIEEIALDFQVVAQRNINNPDNQDVLLVATRRETVEIRKTILETAQLIPLVVDLDSHALENTLIGPLQAVVAQHDTDRTPVVVADVGSGSTMVYVFYENQVVFAREQNIGVQQLLTRLSTTQEGPLQTIRAALFSDHGHFHEESLQAISSFEKLLAQQIAQASRYYRTSGGAKTIPETFPFGALMLIGGGASIPGLPSTLKQHLQTPVVILNPLDTLTPWHKASRINDSGPEGARYAVACGLALRGLGA